MTELETRVEERQTYADGFCAQCSELAYPLTRALESTGVPTGEDGWQQTYGPNKVRALSDHESCLRRLLLALEEGKPETIKARIDAANHHIEYHAAVRRRLTAQAQKRDAPADVPEGEPTRTIDCHAALHGRCKRCGLTVEQWTDSVCPAAPTAAPATRDADGPRWCLACGEPTVDPYCKECTERPVHHRRRDAGREG